MSTPQDVGSPRDSLDTPRSSITLPKRRGRSPASSLANLPYRRSNPSLSSLFASTSSLPASRPGSGSGTPPAPLVGGSVFSPSAEYGGASPINLPLGQAGEDPRTLILRGLSPHVGVLSSTDTEEIIRSKGLPAGLLELLRPFGDTIQGKVTIRDSIGASKSFSDYSVRFVGLKDGLGIPARRSLEVPPETNGTDIRARADGKGGRSPRPSFTNVRRIGGDVGQIEEVVDKHLAYAEFHGSTAADTSMDYLNHKEAGVTASSASSPFYSLYLRRLLSGLPLSPHETFSHPVACIIAISSHNPSPIEELRRLYASTNNGDYRLPQWVNNEYLRYYVLVHDEDNDDIAKSTALYEQMKRHFGLHCHLLRLRRTQCLPSDDDSVRLPKCEWVSAGEEVMEIQSRESAEDVDDPTPCLFESDATAIRTFVRELTTQSIVPSMERLVMQWNEQILSRRRGVAGRFMSLSKRWNPLSNTRTSSGPLVGSSLGSSSNSNYDSLQGFYRPDTPEAQMRKLADYAFMLRDFKLAQSTYDLLRTDFNNDKAWKYYAGANEMAAISLLLSSSTVSSKTRTEAVDQMLETASYSYITRCAAPYNALRALSLGLELLRLRGSSASDDAARWASRILEAKLVGPVGDALFTERSSVCYAARRGTGSMLWGSRRRKAALWAILAADSWLKLDRCVQAEKCLKEAVAFYGVDGDKEKRLPFDAMQQFLEELREEIADRKREMHGRYESDDCDGGNEQGDDDAVVEVATETLDARPHRKSLIGAVAPLSPLDAPPLSPLSPVKLASEESRFRDDSFQDTASAEVTEGPL